MTKAGSRGIRGQRLLAALAIAGAIAGCSKSTSGHASPSPSATTPTAIASDSSGGTAGSSGAPSSGEPTGSTAAGGCPATCATGDDGMQYRVTSTRRFTGPGAISVVAVGFSIMNQSSAGHDFDASGGGFSADLASGGTVQLENVLSAASAGDPQCYTDPVIYHGGTDPGVVHVDPGSTLAFPKQICMSLAVGDKITAIEFADQDASNNAVVTFPLPI